MPGPYLVFSVNSVTRPDLGVGLMTSYATLIDPFTREYLEGLAAEDIGLYLDSPLMQQRGEERKTEQFVLVAKGAGGWETIKPISPASGAGPRDDDEDDEGHEAVQRWWEENPNHPAVRAADPYDYPEDAHVM